MSITDAYIKQNDINMRFNCLELAGKMQLSLNEMIEAAEIFYKFIYQNLNSRGE